MKKLIFLFIIVINCNKILAQSIFINLEKFNLTGYVFEEHFEPAFFKIKNIAGRFTPSTSDIEKAEQLVHIFVLQGSKHIKQQRRQYLGFKKGNNSYLFVNVMYYKSKKQFSKDFPDWNTEIENYFTEIGQEKNSLYLINLNENTIGFYNDDF